MAKHINNILEFISSWGNSEFSSSLLSEVLSPEDILKKAEDEKDEKKRTSLYTMAKSRKKRVEAIQGKVTKIETDLENPDWRARGESGRFLPDQKGLKMAEKEKAEKGKDIISRVGNDAKQIQKRRQEINLDTLDPEKESRRQGLFQKKIDRFTNRTDETSSSKKSDKPKEAEEDPSIGSSMGDSVADRPPSTLFGRLKRTTGRIISRVDPAMVLAGLGLAHNIASGIKTAAQPFTGPGGKNPKFTGRAFRDTGTNAYILVKMHKLGREIQAETDPKKKAKLESELRSIRRSVMMGGFMGSRYNS